MSAAHSLRCTVLCRVAAICTFVLVLTLNPTAAPAAEGSGGGPVKLATGNDYAPYTDRNLPGGGLVTRLVREAFARAGRSVSVAFVSWPRAYTYAQSGAYDAVFPYVRTRERAAKFHYSAPIIQTYSHVISPATAPVRFGGALAALHGHTMCLPQGYAVEDRLKSLVDAGRLRLVQPGSPELCVRLLLAQRADFVILSVPAFKQHVESENGSFADFHVSEGAVGSSSLYLIAPRSQAGSPSLIEGFNRGLMELRADGTYEDIVGEQDEMPGQRHAIAHR